MIIHAVSPLHSHTILGVYECGYLSDFDYEVYGNERLFYLTEVEEKVDGCDAGPILKDERSAFKTFWLLLMSIIYF